MLTATPLAAGNDAYVEAMYERYLAQPDAVPAHWREYFASLGPAGQDIAHGPLIEELARRAKAPRHAAAGAGARTRAARQRVRPVRRRQAIRPPPSRAPCRASSRSTRTAAT